MRSSCLKTLNATPIFKVVFVVLCSYSVAYPSQEHHMLTSLNSSKLVFRIPRDYKTDIPIFSIQLLRPAHYSYIIDYEKSYQEKTTKECDKSKRSARMVYEEVRLKSNRELIQEKRRKKEKRHRGSSEVVGLDGSNNSGGESNKSTRRHRDQSKFNRDRKGYKSSGYKDEFMKAIRAQLKTRDFLKLVSKQKDLFKLKYSLETGNVSVFLKRTLILDDYTDLRESSVSFEIQERLPRELECEKKTSSSNLENSNKYQLMFEVVLHVTEPFNCNRLTEKMCLLPEDFIQLQQWENESPGSLLVLPSLNSLCPDITRNIVINMKDLNENFFQPELIFRPSLNAIYTDVELDRELRDSILNFTIICELQFTKKSSSSKSLRKESFGYLFVRDVDDSPPMRLKTRDVMWKITDNLDHLDDKLMIIDADIDNEQNYTIEVIGDTYGLIQVQSQSEFVVTKDICARETSSFPSSLTAGCTILTTHLIFDERSVKSYPPKVHFSLAFLDNSLLSRMNDQSYKVMYDVTLILDDLSQPSVWHPIMNVNKSLKFDDELPTEINVTLYRPLQIYSRLHQMLHASLEQAFQRLSASPRTFSMMGESSSLGLDITPLLGILYISDPETLQDVMKENERLEVVVKRGTNFTASIFIELSDESITCDQKKPKPSYITVAAPTSCAIHSYRKSCEKSCGVGSLSGKCSWRSFNGSFTSTHFATCSPDLITCPDGFCDELETNHKDICPQDCVEVHRTKGSNINLNTEYDPPRGILRGFGVCTCNDYCQCFPANPEMSPTIRHRPRPPEPTVIPPGSCEAACQVGVSIAIIIGLFLLVIFFCRRRKDCGGKFKDGASNQAGFQSGFMEDHSSSGPAHREAHAVSVHAVHNIHTNSVGQNIFNNNNDNEFAADLPLVNFTVDRKWEFPRSKLTIEQTLGEGEFGKVMKGLATELGGLPGTSVVAVKMLKNNSTAAELGDLLSEYHLLKEVNHPNVIKLLGACTTKDGPIYLLIEYCKYGSLRSYLRRSRHFELESRVGSTPHEESPGDYHLTPKQLLSFAWQICKGMDYLGSMKLVHRDLAARNVLLAEGKTCKISDFGLTRDVYEGDLYFKRSKGRVPVKWMAIESLVDHVYTSKSDIWGFGVLLWELITLGSSPYPGVTPERLFTILQTGYRMEKPDNCSDELFLVMKSCWHDVPSRRPTFNELVSIFARMIEANVEYLELRSLIVTNRSYFDDPVIANEIFPEDHMKQVSSFSIEKKSDPAIIQPIIDETRMDKDSYLLARSSFTLEPPGRLDTKPTTLLGNKPATAKHMTFNGTHIHAHNPAYSPARQNCPTFLQPISPPLQYSSLDKGPDEEEYAGIVIEEGQDASRSEADSDSGRATGDSGYLTEDGRKSKDTTVVSSVTESFGKPLISYRGSRGSSYSPITIQDREDEQNTYEDFEERQILLKESIAPFSETVFQHQPKEILKKTDHPSVLKYSSSNLSSGEFVNSQMKRRNPVQV